MSELPRRIGFWGASAVMVGVMIGSGIFATPTTIAQNMSSPALILALWAAGGLLALFGALTYAELACMYPESGGVYVFIREGLGRPAAFTFGWTYLLISKPMAAAGIAWVFGTHINTLLGVHWDERATTITILTILTAVNTLGRGVDTGLAVLLTGLKFLALAAIVAAALVLLKGSTENFTAKPAPKSILVALAPVLAAIMWTYDGWSDVGSIAGEVKDPGRRLPLIYLTGTAAVTLLYIAVNAVYIWLVPLAEMATVETVAPLVMGRLLGPAAAAVVTVLALVSTLGSTHGSIITGARVSFAQSRDGLLFAFLGRIQPRFQTPAVSLWIQLGLSCAAVLIYKDFGKFTDGFVFTMWIFYGAAAVSIFVLRVRRPDVPRPFHCWGYPVVPAIFVAAAAFMTMLALIGDKDSMIPWVSDDKITWLGVVLTGFPVYYIWQRLPGRNKEPRARARGSGFDDSTEN